MSSILLSNPFATVPHVSHAATEGLIVPAALTAVAPAQAGSGARGAGDAGAYGGTGSGQGRSIGSNSQQAVVTDRRGALSADRPPNATADSVVGAQSNDTSATNAPQADARDADLRNGITVPEIPEPVIDGEMPDPLPTSPFLKMMSGRD